MDSQDGEHFIKQLAAFVRTHEKALANALQFQRREVRHRPSQSTGAAALAQSSPLPERPSTSASTSSSLAAAFSFGPINFTSHNVKPAKLALTPHHLFYLLSRTEELGINVGPMKVRLESIHDASSSSNYVSFLGNTGRSRSHSSDVGSIHSVSSMRSVMSGMSALWSSLGIGASISAARTERHKAAVQADLKYLYSAFTKIPCLRLAPDWRARLIRGYEEFPFDSAVPLYVFKNLQALEVNAIDFRQFFGWDRLADQLRSLSLRQAGIEDPTDILIDIVLGDMDKRRRRTSKSQPSPTATLASANSPRRSPTMAHPDLVRAASAPGSPDTRARAALAELRVGSVTPGEPTTAEDTDASDTAKTPLDRESGEANARFPAKRSRPRSSSPTRPASSRNHSSNLRTSQRVRRSGSGSSHSSMSDSWHHHARGSSGNLLATGALPASKWRFLRHLSLADNAMTAISSASLAPLHNTLFSLDLSSNLFSQIPDSLAALTALRALNLSQCMIDSLHSLTRNPLPAINALNLRANRLESLAGVERLFPLERLDLRDNRLTDSLELARLTDIPELREIWVEGNPFTRTHKDYRTTIFNLFRATPGNTVDVIIDGSGPSQAEKRGLVERAPIPTSAPVVRPRPFETAAIVSSVGKPAIVYGALRDREPSVLRKERPAPKAATSEVNTSATRWRNKTSKRRIVDLATTTDDAAAVAATPVEAQKDAPPTSSSLVAAAAAATATAAAPSPPPLSPPPSNYRVSRPAESKAAVPPVVTSQCRTMQPPSQPPARLPQLDTSGARQASGETHDWDASGEMYRRKIVNLRERVGSGYLSVLSEESWDGSSSFMAPGAPTVPPLRAGHMSSNAVPVHSGRAG